MGSAYSPDVSMHHNNYRHRAYPDGVPSSGVPYMDDRGESSQQPAQLTDDPSFDIIEWHPAYQSCQRYFLDHAQHEPGTQALCSLVNIRLPFQWLTTPITCSSASGSASVGSSNSNLFNNPYARPANNVDSPNRSRGASNQAPAVWVSLIPYIRRLIVTGFDKPPILHGFFGDEYIRGVLPHVDCERRNYLFAAKHGGWRSCKKMYDTGSGGGGDETVPFLKPMDEARMEELVAAEKAWSSWLAMEDWMVGPRAPDERSHNHNHNGGRRHQDGDMPDGV